MSCHDRPAGNCAPTAPHSHPFQRCLISCVVCFSWAAARMRTYERRCWLLGLISGYTRILIHACLEVTSTEPTGTGATASTSTAGTRHPATGTLAVLAWCEAGKGQMRASRPSRALDPLHMHQSTAHLPGRGRGISTRGC